MVFGGRAEVSGGWAVVLEVVGCRLGHGFWDEGDALAIVQRITNFIGFEAWRHPMARYAHTHSTTALVAAMRVMCPGKTTKTCLFRLGALAKNHDESCSPRMKFAADRYLECGHCQHVREGAWQGQGLCLQSHGGEQWSSAEPRGRAGGGRGGRQQLAARPTPRGVRNDWSWPWEAGRRSSRPSGKKTRSWRELFAPKQ